MGMVWLLALLACTHKGGEDTALGTTSLTDGASTATGPHNVLILIADDIGIEASTCYPELGVQRAPQPNIQRLCRGVVFERAWSSPVCSPTRAGMMTGRASWRHGVGEAIDDVPTALDDDETILPEALDLGQTGYSSAHFGKWHLGTDVEGPNAQGWPHFDGTLPGELPDYYHYDKVVDGEIVAVDDYATTQVVDDTLGWIDQQDGLWVAWVAFNAPHTPLHLPPTDLQDYTDLSGTDADIAARPGTYFQAIVQAMDTEIGRLLDGLGEDVLANTTVIYLGDNGTAGTNNQGYVPANHAKASLYQGGVEVPLIIDGPLITQGNRRVSAPVSTVDLFATVLELTGATASATAGVDLDSVSLVPQLVALDAAPPHAWILSEIFGSRTNADAQGRALTDGRFKLLSLQDRGEELYDLDADPKETSDLLGGSLSSDASDAYAALSKALATLPDLPSE